MPAFVEPIELVPCSLICSDVQICVYNEDIPVRLATYIVLRTLYMNFYHVGCSVSSISDFISRIPVLSF